MDQKTRQVARICDHCGYTEAGIAVGNKPQLEGDTLDQIERCPVLANKGTGLGENCPYWQRAKLQWGPAV